MKFKIPFTFSDTEILRRRSKFFSRFVRNRKSRLDDYLKESGEKIDRRGYLSICYRNFSWSFLITLVFFTSLFGLLRIDRFYLIGLGISLGISGFLFINQSYYPRIFMLNKKRDLEKNLIPAMQDMLVQLNSGVAIFRILANLSDSDYGEVSEEFKKITKEINSGVPQIEALENHGKLSNSIYFKRILWQISNGMRAGSDMSIVIKEGVKSLNEEQSIQIQGYGSKLNPLVMFYMLIAVIIPALGVTFMIILASMLNLSGSMIKLLFFAIFTFIIFIQIMFLGIIKSKRPSLL